MKNNKPENYDDIAQCNVWTVEIPTPVKRKEKLSEDSELLITIIDGKAEAFIITDTTTKDKWVKEWIEKNKEFMEKMAELGD